jgi:hypothetical protein
MPFRSESQRRYFEHNKEKLSAQGVDIKEWQDSSKGLKLPERVGPKPTFKRKMGRAFPRGK